MYLSNMNRNQTMAAFKAAGGEDWWMSDHGVDFNGMIDFLQDFARVSRTANPIKHEDWMSESDTFASQFDE